MIGRCFDRIADIPNVAVQIFTDSQKDRESHFFIPPQFCHGSSGYVQILAKCGRRYFLLDQTYPQLFVTYFHDGVLFLAP